jgi:hypothetical protein
MSELWNPEYEPEFEKWFVRLDGYKQAVLDAAVQKILKVYGTDICDMEWGKPLGSGLYEFRVRQSLHAIHTWGDAATPAPQGTDRSVLLRVFVTFHGRRVVLLLSGYDKGKDPSDRRQQRELKRARRILTGWKKRNGR